jgi:hypothetical protein
MLASSMVPTVDVPREQLVFFFLRSARFRLIHLRLYHVTLPLEAIIIIGVYVLFLAVQAELLTVDSYTVPPKRDHYE